MATFIVYIRNIKMYQILYMVKNKYYLIILSYTFFLHFDVRKQMVQIFPVSHEDTIEFGVLTFWMYKQATVLLFTHPFP